MRAPIASALLVMFGLLCSAHTAAAQSSPVPSQPPQVAPEKAPSAAKPLEPLLRIEIPSLSHQSGSANDPTLTLQELKTWMQTHQDRKDGLPMVIMRSGGGPDAPNCAHIRIIQAPETDAEMVVEAAPGAGGNITTFPGLPPCRRDLPTMAVQGFYGVPPKPLVPPRTPFVQPPVLQVPSAQPRSVQPKTDTPVEKP